MFLDPYSNKIKVSELCNGSRGNSFILEKNGFVTLVLTLAGKDTI